MAHEIKNLLDTFITALKQSGTGSATLRNYTFYLKRFFRWGPIHSPDDITGDRIEQFMKHLGTLRNQQGALMKPTTQNYHRIALRAFIKFLNEQGYATLDPKKIHLAKTKRSHAPTLTQAELEKLLNAPLQADKAGIIQKRDKALLELLFSTGMKVSEIASLKKKQINFFRDDLEIRTPPRKIRRVPLTNLTKYCIQEYLKERTDSFPALFIRHDKAQKAQLSRIDPAAYQLTPRTIQRIVKRYVKSAGLDNGTTPESLRRTHARYLLKRGADLNLLKEQMGHVSITTTQLYADN